MTDRDTFAAAATFGLAEMQQFVEAHSDSRVRAIWRRLVEARSKNARWCEAAAAAEKKAARLRLTDAEREVLSEERDDLEAGGFAAHAAVIDGLLARASKEGR